MPQGRADITGVNVDQAELGVHDRPLMYCILGNQIEGRAIGFDRVSDVRVQCDRRCPAPGFDEVGQRQCAKRTWQSGRPSRSCLS